jgi:hypothetical protein
MTAKLMLDQIQRMLNLLQIVANVVTILTLFLPVLSGWGRSLAG